MTRACNGRYKCFIHRRAKYSLLASFGIYLAMSSYYGFALVIVFPYSDAATALPPMATNITKTQRTPRLDTKQPNQPMFPPAIVVPVHGQKWS